MPVEANGSFRRCLAILTADIEECSARLADRSAKIEFLASGGWDDWAEKLGADEESAITWDDRDEDAVLGVLKANLATIPAAGVCKGAIMAETQLSRPRLNAAMKRLRDAGRIATRENAGSWLLK